MELISFKIGDYRSEQDIGSEKETNEDTIGSIIKTQGARNIKNQHLRRGMMHHPLIKDKDVKHLLTKIMPDVLPHTNK